MLCVKLLLLNNLTRMLTHWINAQQRGNRAEPGMQRMTGALTSIATKS